MSFYTSLTGLNGAQADIAAISNNIANVGTTGFKRSRAEFGDIFATSPLQANSSAVGSGTIMKSIKQQFTQGNIESSLNALDLSISGQGFFALKPSLTSTQTVYTRNGAFSVNNDRYVVDAQGQLLQVFPVNADGSVIATGIESAKNLQLPTTSGLPKASQTIQLGLNLPADATIIPNSKGYDPVSNPYVFDKTNPATYNQSTSITIYDSLGNATIATIYYVKTSNATEVSPTNKWQTHVFVGDREVTPQLITAKDDQSRTFYINKFGQITTAPQSVDPTFNAGAAHPLYKQDDQIDKTPSTAASVVGGIIKSSGFDFGDTDAEKVTIITDPARYTETRENGGQSSTATPKYWGRDMFSLTVDGSAPQSISVRPGAYTGTQLAAEMTRAVNEKFGGKSYFSITDTYRREGGTVVAGNDVIKLSLSRLTEDGASEPLANPIEIDLLGTAGASGTPIVNGKPANENKLQLTRDQLLELAQSKLNDALNARHLEFGKPSNWPDAMDPPIKIGYDVASRSFTFTVAPGQMGLDANEPASRFNKIQVFNPTDVTNDLGIPPSGSSPDTLIRANTLWSGTAALPGGDPIVDPREQRTGIQVIYNKDTRQFSFNSGSTGETSSITVGRAQLATVADILPQINAYDLSSESFTTAKLVTLEVAGRTLDYKFTPLTTGNPTAAQQQDAFFSGLEQAVPVTTGEVEQTQEGNSQTKEIQTVNVYGKVMSGDKFSITLQRSPTLGPITITTDEITSYIDPATSTAVPITANTSTSNRLKALGEAITAAIDDYNTNYPTAQIAATMDQSANTLTLSYEDTGPVASSLVIEHVQRGSDTLSTKVLFTEETVRADLPTIEQGSQSIPTKQTLQLTSTTGAAPSFNSGDTYRISIPQSDGSTKIRDVTLTAATIADLVTMLNATGTDGFNVGVFTALEDTTGTPNNKLQFTYNTNGPITGALTFKQINVGGGADGVARVRPPNIGPITVQRNISSLEVVGDPAGNSFKLNLRLNGVVQNLTPIGSSGSTSRSGIAIGQAKSTTFLGSNDLLGIGSDYTAVQRFVEGTGLPAKAAVATGTRGVTPMSQTFFLNEALGENRMTFTIDGIVGTITLPIRAYTGDTFAAAIEDRVNQIEDPKTGRIVSGVTVKFDADNNRLIFTSGTTGADSQINVVGHPNFGLAKVAQDPGSVPIITNLKQATDSQGNKLYVDAGGNITTQAPLSTQNWYPLYLQEGQLTFDTVGKLISPKEGVVYSPFDPQNGSDLLRLNIDYGKFSTQYSSPFSVLSLSQDGYPSGSLNGLDIDASGTIRANYTNGETAALGKIMVANFANANGLKQVGNATYVATSVSGQAVLGQAGADGFGTIKAGALERSNVDITQELVNLITAQRNFQANAKAIETTTTLSQTIIQIRG